MLFTGGPTTVGHRGLGAGEVAGHRENTLGSFLAAADAGVDWVEVDVRRTADDRLVVAHHPAYDDGVFHVDHPVSLSDQRGVLRLDALLEALPARVGVDLDLKSSMEDAWRPGRATTAALLAPAAAAAARTRPVALTSFDPAALMAVRELAPGVATGLLTWLRFPVEHAVAAAVHLDVQLLSLHVGSLRLGPDEPGPVQRPLEHVVASLHAHDRQLLVWCPAPDRLGRLVAAGVDAVCLDDVPAALPVLAALRRDRPASAGVRPGSTGG